MRASTQENRPKIFIDDVTLIFNESWRFQRLEHSAKKQRNKNYTVASKTFFFLIFYFDNYYVKQHGFPIPRPIKEV